jgi:RND family efflux transporter MFP subunit
MGKKGMKKKIFYYSALSVLILVIAGFTLYHFYSRQEKKLSSVNRTVVQLQPIQIQTIPITATATGTLAANQQTHISPKLGGYITRLYFNEGQYVKAGTQLITLDDSKEQQQLLSTQAEASLAKATYERYLTLSQQHITSPQDIDQYRANYKKAQAAQKANEAALADMTLRAPINGYLGAKMVSIGDYVNPGQNLVSITDTKILKVQYALPSRYVPQLKIGQSVNITADFLPGKTFTANVSYIAPDVDPDTQTIEVHALLKNKKQALKSGQSIMVTQKLGVQKQALLVPADAVIANINGHYVYEVKHNKVISVPVVVGEHYKNNEVILKGLNPNDRIITKGQYQVNVGAFVRVATK